MGIGPIWEINSLNPSSSLGPFQIDYKKPGMEKSEISK